MLHTLRSREARANVHASIAVLCILCNKEHTHHCFISSAWIDGLPPVLRAQVGDNACGSVYQVRSGAVISLLSQHVKRPLRD